MQSITARLLGRAAELVGGREALCHELQVPGTELDLWMAGARPMPRSLFLKVADLLLDEAATPNVTKTEGAQPSAAATQEGETEPRRAR